MPSNQVALNVWDYLIIAVALITSTCIGIYFRCSGGKQKTSEEYLMGDKKMSVFLVSNSIMAYRITAITILSEPTEVYNYGLMFEIHIIGELVGVIITNYLYLPVFYKLQNFSTYEYLELRFGPGIRSVASIIYFVDSILYIGMILYVPAIVIEVFTGISHIICVGIVGVVCAFCSVLGGLKAVAWSDLFLKAFQLAALISILTCAIKDVGGISEVFRTAQETGRLSYSSTFDPTYRYSWISIIFGSTFIGSSIYTVLNDSMQKLKSVPTLTKARLSLFMNWPFFIIVSFALGVMGIAIQAVYKDCDPYSAGLISKRDQLIAFYLLQYMSHIPGMNGLFVAGVLGSATSTASGTCNSLAAVVIEDFICQWIEIKPKIKIWLTKVIAFLVVVVFVLVAFVVERFGGLMQASLTVTCISFGALLPVFTLGLLTTFATELGAILGSLSSLAVTIWMSYGGSRPPEITLPMSTKNCSGNVSEILDVTYNPDDYGYAQRLCYMWVAPIGLVVGLVVGTSVSLIWPVRQPWQKKDPKGTPNPDLFSPPLAYWLRRKQANQRNCINTKL